MILLDKRVVILVHCPRDHTGCRESISLVASGQQCAVRQAELRFPCRIRMPSEPNCGWVGFMARKVEVEEPQPKWLPCRTGSRSSDPLPAMSGAVHRTCCTFVLLWIALRVLEIRDSVLGAM